MAGKGFVAGRLEPLSFFQRDESHGRILVFGARTRVPYLMGL